MPISRSEVIFIISLIALFISIMICFIIYILFFIKNKQKGFNSDLNAVKENYDKELFKAQMEIQEQTFGEISREIHDNVGQLLSLAKLGLTNLDFGERKQAMYDASEIAVLLDKALEDLRHMSHAMNADFIKKNGLQKSIELQVEFLRRNTHFETLLLLDGTFKRISPNKEIILFRILQEAVNNIIRHSGATAIQISLVYHKDYMVFTIDDNGNGFILRDDLTDKNHLNGISNIRFRSQLINANLKIFSEPGKGTTIEVKVNY